jgi:DeoR/GlpR family transcriptional regulator of sugar metabolism
MSAIARVTRILQLLDLQPDISLDELSARLGMPASIVRGDLRRIRDGKD